MQFARMVAGAAAMAMSGGAALLAGLGVGGQRSGWLDVINASFPCSSRWRSPAAG
jgi:hypothetical protein